MQSQNAAVDSPSYQCANREGRGSDGPSSADNREARLYGARQGLVSSVCTDSCSRAAHPDGNSGARLLLA